MSNLKDFLTYRVTLTGFSTQPMSERRCNAYFATTYPGHKAAHKFPVGGLVIGLNLYGEPIVVPDYPAHSICLPYFDYTLEK